MSEERKTEYIALPERDALIFVSASTNDFFKVVIPDAVQNYALRLITPKLEQYAQEGWVLDEFEFHPLEPDYEPVVGLRLLVPFTQVRFRYKGVIAHLRRVRTENRRYPSSGNNQSGGAALRKAFRDAETIRDMLHERIEKDSGQTQSMNEGRQTLADLQEFARNGLAGLCKRMGVPETKTASIFVSPPAKMWLQEVLLKHAIFSLLLMGKGLEITTIRAALYAGFGEDYVDGITAEAMVLYEEFAHIFAQAQRTGDTALYAQLVEIVRRSVTSSTELEKYH